MFQAVCQLDLEGIVFKETGCALSLRPLEGLDQSQKSECTSCNSRYRWDVLSNHGSNKWPKSEKRGKPNGSEQRSVESVLVDWVSLFPR